MHPARNLLPSPQRRCDCGTLLARDQSGPECSACRLNKAQAAVAPTVPPDFWTHQPLSEALRAAHMGRVLRCYRHHPWHGRNALPQPVVAEWLRISQPQLSRIENGAARTDLAWLIFVAGTLAIPAPLLWFRIGNDEPEPPADHKRLRLVAASHDADDLLRDDGDQVATVRLDLTNGASVAVTVDAESGPVHLLISARDDSNNLAHQRLPAGARPALHAVAESPGAVTS